MVVSREERRFGKSLNFILKFGASRLGKVLIRET